MVVLAMSAVLVTWFILGSLLIGVGLVFQRSLGLRALNTSRLFMAFWFGVAGTIVFLQLYHLKWAIGHTPLVIVSIVGALGLLWNAGKIHPWSKKIIVHRQGLIIAILLLSVWLSNRAIGTCSTSDSGIYHLNMVRWASEYSIVPGLANVHNRFGFNNANFLFAAMVEGSVWHYRSSHVVNGLFILALMAQGLVAARVFLNKDHKRRVTALFDLFLLTAAAHAARHSWISSHSPDLPLQVVVLVAGSKLFSMLFKLEKPPQDDRYATIFIVVMMTLAVCIKLSAVIFGFLSTVLVVTVFVVQRVRWDLPIKGTVGVSILAGLLLIGPWMIRGVITSGYPAYPSNIGAAPVSWAIKKEDNQKLQKIIQSFARGNLHRENEPWFGQWLKKQKRELYVPLFLFMVAAISMVFFHRYLGPHSIDRTIWLIFLPTVSAIVFWFLMGPAIRFGSPFFWITAASMMGILFMRFSKFASSRLLKGILSACLILFFMNIGKFFQSGGTDFGFRPTPTPKLTVFTTQSGLQLYIPDKDDFSRCWDSPLPCAPHPNPDLRLRRKGDLGSGFVLEKSN